MKQDMLLLLVLFSVDSGLAQCDPYNGPGGRTSCVHLKESHTPGKYQWATCLTNTDIQQKSNYKYRCRDHNATYCWYQCMAERYNRHSGDVWGSCLCDPQGRTPMASLSDWCRNSSTNSCKWYRECLGKIEKRKNCKNTTNGYSVKYAEEFCQLFDGNYSDFTKINGYNRTIDAVRKCLKGSPLRSWDSVTCEQLGEKTFDFQSRCVFSPDRNKLSVCALLEFHEIFRTIEKWISIFDTAEETINKLWNKKKSLCPKTTTTIATTTNAATTIATTTNAATTIATTTICTSCSGVNLCFGSAMLSGFLISALNALSY